MSGTSLSGPHALRRICAKLALGFLAFHLASCAYRAGYDLPERYSSYGVEIFANSSREPDLERPLHDALTRTLADHAGARILRPSLADAVIRGRILTSERRGGIRSPQNEWLESGKRLLVQAELVDSASGEVLSQTRTFVQVGFVFDHHGGEAGARDYALDNAAQRLVIELLQKLNAKEMERSVSQESAESAPITP
ncbi:MAG: LPS assembly lipoprotein LptE [Planctomycetota bacterium]|nr:LPS assembly lipoprotein LptE [Planctomycetota bacterium]